MAASRITSAEVTPVSVEAAQSELATEPNGDLESLDRLDYNRQLAEQAVASGEPTLTRPEVANELGVPYSSLIKLVNNYQWPPFVFYTSGHKTGKHHRFPRPFVDDLRVRMSGRGTKTVDTIFEEARSGYVNHLDQLTEALDDPQGRIRADKLVKDRIALFGVKRAINEGMLPAIRALGERDEHASTHWNRSERFGTGILKQILDVYAPRDEAQPYVLIGDATGGDGRRDHLEMWALAWGIAQRRVNVDVLSVEHSNGISNDAQALEPKSIVIAGGNKDPQTVKRWADAALAGAQLESILLFRCPAFKLDYAVEVVPLQSVPEAAVDSVVSAPILPPMRRRWQ